MRRSARLLGLFALFALLMGGCDSFSLSDYLSSEEEASPDEITTNELSLTIQKTTLLPGETIQTVATGGKGPYTLTAVENDISAATVGNDIGSFSSDQTVFTAGAAIGKIDLTVLDSLGAKDTKTITVIPPAPTGLYATASGTGTIYITLHWAYSHEALISSFAWTSTNVNDGSTTSGSISKNERSTTITGNPNKQYRIILESVSGSYTSAPIETTVSTY
ncbi:MAG: hypothetical protein JW875_06905 [Spirochaetales bacterium]|nr:hypothetical protein [Spirochaetales bacterium]